MILLINPGHDGSHGHKSHRAIHRDPPPMSLLYVAANYTQRGETVQILDTHINHAWKGIIRQAKDIDWIGISVIIGQNLANAGEITEWIRKKKPGVTVVWGGVMPTVYPNATKVIYGPDDVFVGRMDESIMPAWELLGNDFNKQQIPYYHMVMTSSGCPFSCSFCYKHSLPDGEAYKLRSSLDVIDELEYMHYLTGTKVFTFGDDNFLINKGRAIAILDYMRGKGWYAEEVIGHFNGLDDELIAAMGGVVQTFIGSVESASPRLQKLLNKHLDIDSVPDKLQKLNQVGIAANTPFIIGLPTETDEDLKLNWQFMEYVRARAPWVRGQIYLWYPLPKTVLTTYAEKTYNVNLRFGLKEYERANFWVDEKLDGREFRPWISEERYELLYKWGTEFKEAFHYPGGHGPYVLDRVLSGEEINLVEGLI